jgi:tellurium resistance protein TerD
MKITLKKGEEFNLTQNAANLSKILVALGWKLEGNQSFDLDASVFMLGNSKKLVAEEYFIFYNNKESPDGSVTHTGDKRVGSGQDDETLLINFPLISPAIAELVVVVSIHESHLNKRTFEPVHQTYIRVDDLENQTEIVSFELGKDFKTDSAVEFGRFVKSKGEWFFKATGVGKPNGLQGFVDVFA